MGEIKGTNEDLTQVRMGKLRIIFALTGTILWELPHRRAPLKKEDFLIEKWVGAAAVYVVEVMQGSGM